MPYYFIFFVTCVLLLFFQKNILNVVTISMAGKKYILSGLSFLVLWMFCVMPVLIMYGLRSGIGTDYYTYEKIYLLLHDKTWRVYWNRHVLDIGYYYVESGYYILNRIAGSYRGLLFLEGTIIYLALGVVENTYKYKINIAFSVFIYLATQYTYSLNGVRFSIAVVLVLIGYVCLAEDKMHITCVLFVIAGLFHKTALFCFVFIFLIEYKNYFINKVRNLALFVVIFAFPLVSKLLFLYSSRIDVFSRYFTTDRYNALESLEMRWIWLLHIVPVMAPIVLIGKDIVRGDRELKLYFRIYLMEIPCRMLGLYNTWYTRFTRYTQIIEIIFIPLVLTSITDKKIKRLLSCYYIIWFIFYFAYYAIIGANGDSLPYSFTF